MKKVICFIFCFCLFVPLVKAEELISDLDPDHRFNYCHVIEEDYKIDDPLTGAAFMNPNHIFNEFTICQMDTTSNSSIYVMGKK